MLPAQREPEQSLLIVDEQCDGAAGSALVAGNLAMHRRALQLGTGLFALDPVLHLSRLGLPRHGVELAQSLVELAAAFNVDWHDDDRR